jgi:hypothetical protein
MWSIPVPVGRLHTVIYVVILLVVIVATVYASNDEDRGDDEARDDATEDEQEKQDKQQDEADTAMDEAEEDIESMGEQEVESDDDGASDRLIRRLWLIHGLCAATAWAILVPLAVASSLLRRLLETYLHVAWFPIHRFCNGTAIVLTVVAIAVAVVAYSYDEDGDPHFVDEPHHLVGLLIGIGSILQGLNGFLRPHLPHPPPPAAVTLAAVSEESSSSEINEAPDHHNDDAPLPTKKSLVRISWEYLHRVLGMTLLAASWWQIQSGLYLFADEFYEDDGTTTTRPRDYRPVFFGVVGGIAGTVLLLYACQSCTMISTTQSKA